MLGFSSGVFSAIQRAKRIDCTVGFPVRCISEEKTDVGKFAALTAGNTVAYSVFGNRQYRSKSPF